MELSKLLKKTKYFGLYGIIISIIVEIIIISTGFVGLNHSISYYIASRSWSTKLVKFGIGIVMVLIATSFW
jgi:hypothetical protein